MLILHWPGPCYCLLHLWTFLLQQVQLLENLLHLPMGSLHPSQCRLKDPSGAPSCKNLKTRLIFVDHTNARRKLFCKVEWLVNKMQENSVPSLFIVAHTHGLYFALCLKLLAGLLLENPFKQISRAVYNTAELYKILPPFENKCHRQLASL